jgi:geranylgeranyl pyrophosphate synthase
MSEEEKNVAPGTSGGGYGKDFAGDIKEGKRTLLIVHAFEHADKKEKERMIQLVGKKDITLDEKKEIIEIMKKYGSIEFAKNYARKMMEDAVKKLKKEISETEGRKKLESIAEFLIERKF